MPISTELVDKACPLVSLLIFLFFYIHHHLLIFTYSFTYDSTYLLLSIFIFQLIQIRRGLPSLDNP